MQIKKGIHVAMVGSMITFATFSDSPMNHVNAEENVITENSAKLSTLEIAEFELNQTFSADVTSYTATVTNDIKSMSLLLDPLVEGSLLEVNGEEVSSLEQLSYSLMTGENFFTISVTNGSEVTTYTLTIFRELNNNSKLSNLTLSSGKLTFSPTVTSYTVAIENSTSSLTLKPETAVDTSSVTVNGVTVDTKAGYSIELPVGKTAISFVITAENGGQSTYTVTITRAAKTASDTTNGTTNSTKTNQETNETSTTTTKEQPTVTNLVATTQTESSRLSSSVQSASTSSTPGTQSETPTTASLSTLTVSTGTWNKTFDSDTYTYHVAVGTDVSSVTIAATTDESDAVVEIEGGTSTTVSIPNQAKTAISVTVTHDDDQKTYVLVFDKTIEEVATTETSTTDTEEAAVSETSTSSKTQSMISDKQRTQNKQTTDTSNQTTESSGSFWNWIKSLFTF
jgi:hypothetical protein